MSAMSIALFGSLAAALRALVGPRRSERLRMPVEYLRATGDECAYLGVHYGSQDNRLRWWVPLSRRRPGRPWTNHN